MSGIEAVALVLGLWPVLQNVVGAVKSSKDSSNIKNIGMTIRAYEVIFKQSISKLLQSDEELTDKDRLGLINGEANFAALWKDEEFVNRLRRRLGPDVFNILQHEVEHIFHLMETLQKKIASKNAAIPATGTLPMATTWGTMDSTKSGRRHFSRDTMHNMKLFLQKDELGKSLDDLRKHVQDLRVILEQPFAKTTYSSDQTRDPSSSHQRSISTEQKKRRIDVQFFNEFHRVLCQSFHCRCPVGHECNLRISDNLQIMFRIEEGSRHLSSGSLSEIHSRVRSLTLDSAQILSAPEQTETETASELNRSTWSRPTQESISSTASEYRALVMLCSPTRGVRDVTPISDLCQFLHMQTLTPPSTPPPVTHQYTLGDGARYAVNVPRAAAGDPTVVCMDDWLSSGEWQSSRRKRRIDLAVSLTSAIGLFYPTSWIDSAWTWRSFSVVRGGEPAAAAEDQLCITSRFYSADAPGGGAATQATPLSRFWHTMRVQLDPMLVRLGFALIELALGKRLSEIRASRVEGGSAQQERMSEAMKDMEDYDTAITLLESGVISEDVGDAYHSIVSTCVRCEVLEDVGVRSLKSGSPTFDSDLERFIVEPLRKYHKDTWGHLSKFTGVMAF